MVRVAGFCGHCGARLSGESRFCASCGAPRPEATDQPAPPVARLSVWQVLQNLASIRLIIAVSIIALIPAALASLLHPFAAGVVFFLVFVPVWLLSATNPAQVLYCPYCRKRVKMGADACHHCGRVVTPASGSG